MKRECAQNFAKRLDFRDESNAVEQYSLRVSVGAVIVVVFFVAFFFVLFFFILFVFFGPFSKQDPDGHGAINWVASDEFWRYPAHRLIVHLAPLASAATASDEGRSGIPPAGPVLKRRCRRPILKRVLVFSFFFTSFCWTGNHFVCDSVVRLTPKRLEVFPWETSTQT